jgi:hypothetical protein
MEPVPRRIGIVKTQADCWPPHLLSFCYPPDTLAMMWGSAWKTDRARAHREDHHEPMYRTWADRHGAFGLGGGHVAYFGFAQSSPLIGTWKLNLEKSKFGPGAAPRSGTGGRANGRKLSAPKIRTNYPGRRPCRLRTIRISKRVTDKHGQKMNRLPASG